MVEPPALYLSRVFVYVCISYRVSGSGYTGPCTIQQAVGVSDCRIKMVDDNDNQKEVENAENKSALCFIRYI